MYGDVRRELDEDRGGKGTHGWEVSDKGEADDEEDAEHDFH